MGAARDRSTVVQEPNPHAEVGIRDLSYELSSTRRTRFPFAFRAAASSRNAKQFNSAGLVNTRSSPVECSPSRPPSPNAKGDAPMTKPTERKAWKALEQHHEEMKNVHLRDLFKQDPQRFDKFTLKFNDI